jgi:hypothetical protein
MYLEKERKGKGSLMANGSVMSAISNFKTTTNHTTHRLNDDHDHENTPSLPALQEKFI